MAISFEAGGAEPVSTVVHHKSFCLFVLSIAAWAFKHFSALLMLGSSDELASKVVFYELILIDPILVASMK